MKERLTELQERVRSARDALEALAERTAELRGRVEAARPEDPPFATVPTIRVENDRASLAHDPFMPVRPGASLVSSLERLSQGARPISMTSLTEGDVDGDDGRFVSDAWEIALINEEGE
jgi:hypothetical protein